MRFNFIHFGNLPILAKTFWKVPKYSMDLPEKESFNKIIGIYRSNFKAICCFTHKTDILESRFIINSHFIFSSDKLQIEETCKYSNEHFRIVYSIIERSQEEQLFIFEKENNIRLLPRNIQDTFREIDSLLEENKDKCVIS